jgi:DNA-binding response OmpR family regulator
LLPAELQIVRLLLIEDDAVIARELRLRWSSRGWFVHVCGTLDAANKTLASESARGLDLIVLDLGLPDGDGLPWLMDLRKRDRATPTLILTARDRVADRVQGLHGGADDYLVKPFAVEELDARVEVLTRRAQASRGELIRFARISWLGRDGCAYVGDQLLELPPREFELLGALVRRAPRLVAKRVLVDALAERNMEVGDSAVEVYVSRLRRKLAGSGASIRTMRGFGYLLVLDPVDSQ